MAGEIARSLGLEERVFLPDWNSHGKRAGFMRNIVMLELVPDIVYAFWDGASTGTGHTIGEARRRGIPVDVTLA